LLPASRFQKKDSKTVAKVAVNASSIKTWKSTDNNMPRFGDTFQIAKFAMFKGQVSYTILYNPKLQTLTFYFLLSCYLCGHIHEAPIRYKR